MIHSYGHTEQDISSNTKKVMFNQAVFSGRKSIPQTSKPDSDTNMAPGQSGAGCTEVFNELRAQLERVIDLHERDCEEKCDGVFLYGLLEKKYKNASKELTFIPESKDRRRYKPALLNPSIPISTFLSKRPQILPSRRIQCYIIST